MKFRKQSDLIALQSILELRFQKKQSVFAQVLAEESKLRADVKSLDDSAREAEATAAHHIRAIGADIAWKSYLDKAKAATNRELAQVLAQKQSMLEAVRKEYGKVLVGRDLTLRSQEQISEQRKQTQLQAAIDAHLQKRSDGPLKG